jgi:orotate phosphoribosyltransferase
VVLCLQFRKTDINKELTVEIIGPKETDQSDAAIRIMETVGAIVKNVHVKLSSGSHSDTYVNKDAIFKHPYYVQRLCKMIALLFQHERIDAVIGPTVGGVILAQGVAYQMHRVGVSQLDQVQALYAEKRGAGFAIRATYRKSITGKRILIVDDVVTRGQSLRCIAGAVRILGGDIVGVGVLWNRGGVTEEDVGRIPVLRSLINQKFDEWDIPCHLCKKRIPISRELGHGGR